MYMHIFFKTNIVFCVKKYICKFEKKWFNFFEIFYQSWNFDLMKILIHLVEKKITNGFAL